MLQSLEVTGFRCINRGKVEFDPRCTLFTGANGAGKTSVLEAIYVLSCGRSFRSSHLENLINEHEQSFSIVGQISEPSSNVVGIEVFATSKKIRVNGKNATSFAPIATLLPVSVIEPGAHKLLEEGPNRRRRFIDWGVFHVEPQFVLQWRRYQRALHHRNAALKSNSPIALTRAWDPELVDAGRQVDAYRSSYVTALSRFVTNATARLLGVDVTLAYVPGWRIESSFETALSDSWQRDMRSKTTNVGPHRAELEINIRGVSSRDRVSRGQQKLLACALLLGQLQHRTSTGLAPACLLFDDPAAELDVDNLSTLLAFLQTIPAQLVVAALSSRELECLPTSRMFHVKQGEIVSMI